MTWPTDATAGGRPAIPASACEVLARVPNLADRHPGLQLDKLSTGGTQKEGQSLALDAVVRTRGDGAFFGEALDRRDRMMTALNALSFDADTAGPLTLHLSRASAMENAGICLHPVYGFVHLPASGLKGMARAWAETAWRPQQPDQTVADAVIARVFGTGPAQGVARAGSVIFHDAWPRAWPPLIRDIVNNHHPDYYQGKDAAGDWMDPVPVSFLAVGPGVTFRFAVSARSRGAPEDVALARDWLHAALCFRGAGAKTNAGYGAFVPSLLVPAPVPARGDARFTVTLTLTSPGFFAGAAQESGDCDLRPASLRGQLRWWWRTLHVSALDPDELRRLEALVWGDTSRAGAVRLTVARKDGFVAKITPYDKKKESRGLPRPPHKTVQGLHYASYGMDEAGRRRHTVGAGASWTVTLTARPTGADSLDAETALGQATAALWLLCRYGGVGAKARKGFGSFADIAVPGIVTPEDCLRRAAGVRTGRRGRRGAETPDLVEALDQGLVGEWPVDGRTWQQVIDQAGTTLQDYAKGMVPKPQREHLGVPRQPARSSHTRHAAPYALHLGRTEDGRPVLRFIGFPAARLPAARPDRAASTQVLKGFLAALEASFGAPGGGAGSAGPKPTPPGRRFPRPGFVDGEPVTVLSDNGATYRVEFEGGDIEDVAKSDVSFDP